MEVRDGWSTSYAAQKFDVTVQELDLPQILAEYGFPLQMPGSVANLVIDQLTLTEKYNLLKLTARRFAQYEHARVSEEPTADIVAAQVTGQEMAAVVLAIKVRLGLVAPENPYEPEAAVEPAAAVPA